MDSRQAANIAFTGLNSQGPVPVGILIPPDGKHAYYYVVANTNVDRVTVIDLETLAITGRLTAGLRPDGLAYSPLVLAD